MPRQALFALTLLAAAPVAFAGECEDNFKKSGSPFSGTDFSSVVTVPDLSVADAMGQMRGIMIGEKMDVIAEDVENGTMLVEQRSTGTTRAIPTLINVYDEGGAAAVEMTVKTEKGQFAKAENIRTYMCQLLGKVQGEPVEALARNLRATGGLMEVAWCMGKPGTPESDVLFRGIRSPAGGRSSSGSGGSRSRSTRPPCGAWCCQAVRSPSAAPRWWRPRRARCSPTWPTTPSCRATDRPSCRRSSTP